MRSRKEIETDGKRVDLLGLEVLLDIRDLLTEFSKPRVDAVMGSVPIPIPKRGRPKKS